MNNKSILGNITFLFNAKNSTVTKIVFDSRRLFSGKHNLFMINKGSNQYYLSNLNYPGDIEIGLINCGDDFIDGVTYAVIWNLEDVFLFKSWGWKITDKTVIAVRHGILDKVRYLLKFHFHEEIFNIQTFPRNFREIENCIDDNKISYLRLAIIYPLILDKSFENFDSKSFVELILAYICNRARLVNYYSKEFLNVIAEVCSKDLYIREELQRHKKNLSILENLYIEYIINNRVLERSIFNDLIRDINSLNDPSFHDIYNFVDEVSRGILYKEGLKFFPNDSFTKVLQKKLEFIRSNSKVSRKSPYEHESIIIFTLSKCFPFAVEDSFNSHFNVLKIFSSLIKVYNSLENTNFKVKVAYSLERSYSSPLCVKDACSEELKNFNIAYLVKSEIVDNHDDVVFFSSRNKKNNVDKVSNYLESLRPYSCIFLGGTYDSKLVRSSVYGVVPITYLPTTSSIDNPFGKVDDFFNSLRPISESHSRALIENGVKISSMKQVVKPMFERQELSVSPWQWEMESTKDNFVVCTPLVGMRIPNWLERLSEENFNNFILLFENNPRFCWVAVGVGRTPLSKIKRHNRIIRKLMDEGRIIVIEYTTNLGGLMAECDLVYIPTLGGATTVASAISLGVPALVHQKSDSNTIVTSEGTFSDDNDSFQLLSSTFNNDRLRQLIVRKSKINLEVRFDVNSISKSFFELLQLSRDNLWSKN